MSFAPIAGNESFSNVDNVAAAIQNLDVAEAKITNASTVSLNMDGPITDLYVAPYAQQLADASATNVAINKGQKRLYRVNGFAPSNFINGFATGQGFYFMKNPNQEAATSSADEQLLTLPLGAQIVGAVLTNGANGTLAGATSWVVQISTNTGTFDGTTAPTGAGGTAALYTTTTPTLVNNVGGAAVGLPFGGDVTASIGEIGGTGRPFAGLDAATSVNNLIGCTQTGGPLSGAPAGCNMAISVYYLQDE
tara:strand:- start:294 stop:1043 length:750 start_codon:yes stop_codon:yes gene_type:complete